MVANSKKPKKRVFPVLLRRLTWEVLEKDQYGLNVPLTRTEMLRIEVRHGQVSVDKYFFPEGNEPETIASFGLVTPNKLEIP